MGPIGMRRGAVIVTACVLLVCIVMRGVGAMDASRFKACADVEFCTFGRDVAASGGRGVAKWRVDGGSVSVDEAAAVWRAELHEEDKAQKNKKTKKKKKKSVRSSMPKRKGSSTPTASPPLHVEVTALAEGVTRVQMRGGEGARKRYTVEDVLLEEHMHKHAGAWGEASRFEAVAELTHDTRVEVTVQPEWALRVLVGGEEEIAVNANGWLMFEGNNPRTGVGALTTVGVDIAFPRARAVYGIPEHAARLRLPHTVGKSDPYRLYNLDVFEYETRSPFSLYGSVPLLHALTPSSTLSVLWLNPSETYVDVYKRDSGEGGTLAHATGITTHWWSETGTLDLVLMHGRTPADALRVYTHLTGRPPVPQYFALGYHQSRWSYGSEAEAREVEAGFDTHDVPFDVLWLDLEHTDGGRYFTWGDTFPDPVALQEDLAAHGRRVVTLTDPHIKADEEYALYRAIVEQKLFVRDSVGKMFVAECWPGESIYIDMLNPDARDLWAQQYVQYDQATPYLYTWIDMNEPSVFSCDNDAYACDEVTMPKNNKHHKGATHAAVHNIYGFYHAMATWDGHIRRNATDRPFLLTRAFFAGSQRYAAVWTGDNQASWSHLRFALPMTMSLGLAGFSMAGVDVAGFFGTPSPELFVRFYQACALMPFMRGHSERRTRRREPWVHGGEHAEAVRRVIRMRYALMPTLYTHAMHAHVSGAPIMRPLWWQWPGDDALLGIDTHYMVGDRLLVRPVLKEGATAVSVVFPPGRWYTYDKAEFVEHAETTKVRDVDGSLHVLPLFQRGGTAVLRKDRVRRSSAFMARDPFTLVICVDGEGRASSDFFLDDGASRAFATHAAYARVLVVTDGAVTTARTVAGGVPQVGDRGHSEEGEVGTYVSDVRVERVVWTGIDASAFTQARVSRVGGGPEHVIPLAEDAVGRVYVKEPRVHMTDEWTIHLE